MDAAFDVAATTRIMLGMTRLIARLILAMLILPLSGAIFVLGMGYVASMGGQPGPYELLLIWGALYVFIAVYSCRRG